MAGGGKVGDEDEPSVVWIQGVELAGGLGFEIGYGVPDVDLSVEFCIVIIRLQVAVREASEKFYMVTLLQCFILTSSILSSTPVLFLAMSS